MSRVVPTSTTKTDYRQTTTLDGRDFILRFLWNQREGSWFMSVSDENDDPIVSGVKVTVQLPLLRLVTDERRPAGILMAVDTTAPETDYSASQKSLARDPGIADLGARVLLLYFPQAEAAALGAGPDGAAGVTADAEAVLGV